MVSIYGNHSFSLKTSKEYIQNPYLNSQLLFNNDEKKHKQTLEVAMNRKFKTVVVGGTFEQLHKGHKTLLMKAFKVGDHVIIGLSTNDLARKLKKNHEVATYKERLKELNDFLNEQGVLSKAKIVPLRTPYGITLSKGCVDALVVSR